MTTIGHHRALGRVQRLGALLLTTSAFVTGFAAVAPASDIRVQSGTDANNFDNPFVQPQDPALAGGARDQSLRNGEILIGDHRDDLLVGLLGADFFLGNGGDDVVIGGLEHFAAGVNVDQALLGPGKDIFIWKPGDGSDAVDGGRDLDAVIFGLTGEDLDGNGVPEFEVVADGQAGVLFIDPITGLPLVDVTNSPGFCQVIDPTSSASADEQVTTDPATGGAAAELDALGLEQLVRFFIRGEADNGAGDGDNGLRVTLHFNDVEFLVCTNRDGGAIEVTDLRQSPPVLIDLADIPSRRLRERLQAIVF